TGLLKSGRTQDAIDVVESEMGHQNLKLAQFHGAVLHVQPNAVESRPGGMGDVDGNRVPEVGATDESSFAEALQRFAGSHGAVLESWSRDWAARTRASVAGS